MDLPFGFFGTFELGRVVGDVAEYVFVPDDHSIGEVQDDDSERGLILHGDDADGYNEAEVFGFMAVEAHWSDVIEDAMIVIDETHYDIEPPEETWAPHWEK